MDDVHHAVLDVKEIFKFQCQSIVDMTSIHYGRGVKKLYEISQQTGIHILCCTGFHEKLFMTDYVVKESVQDLAGRLIDEI